MRRSILMLGWMFACSTAGCGSLRSMLGQGVELEAMGVTAGRPSNVAVYLSARRDGQPLDDLDASAFRIYEDGVLVDAAESKQTLLDRKLVADYRTVLLLDLSGDTNQGPEREALARAAAQLAARVSESQPVSVYAFAGDSKPTLLAELAAPSAPGAAELETRIKSFVPADRSRDLASALVEGSRELMARLAVSQKPFRIGTLVVFARGPDLARRVSEDQVWEELERSRHQVIAVGYGVSDYLKHWARDGLFEVKTPAELGPAFDQATSLVIGLERSHYLLSYCSPARAGRRLLRIEAVSFVSGGDMQKGRVTAEFDATGFGPGCDPRQPPRSFPSGPDSAPASSAPQAPGSQPALPPVTTPPPAGTATGTSAQPPEPIVPPPDTPDYNN